MRAIKLLSIFCLTLIIGVYPQMTYGRQDVAKAPHVDSKVIELNDRKTIDELQKITKGEYEGVISGRNPVSIDAPRDMDADSLKGVYDRKRGIKERTFRAPAIPRPKSIAISEGI